METKINMKAIIEGYQSYREAVDTANDYRTKATKHALNDDYQEMWDCEQRYRKLASDREKSYRASYKKLENAIDEAEHRCTVRCISVDDICRYLISVEKRLDITKKAMNGVTVCIDIHAQNFPSAYRGTPESTYFKAVYKNGSWRITEISRRRTSRAGHGTMIHLTEDAKTALLSRIIEY